MSVNAILAAIDEEIKQLEQARRLLAGLSSPNVSPGSIKPAKKRRKLSADARKRIAEAQRRRWAKQKKD